MTSAGEMRIEERISMTRMRIFFYKMNLEDDECG